MKAVIDSARFPAELGGWGLRGVLCAASSLYWALMVGFTALAELAGMAAGIAVWVVIFAGFCVWHAQSQQRHSERLVPALKIAAWIKFLFSAAGWVVFAISSLIKSDSVTVSAGFLTVMPDCLLGMAALAIVSAIKGEQHLESLDSFEWTALTTIVDGALFVLVIAGIALLVLAWWRLSDPHLAGKPKLSPARLAG
jgi:hypothetical protein